MTKPKIIVVVGPNASGKSEFGVKLAKTLRRSSGQAGEIISADSRQIYKGLNIGSGKVEGKWKKKLFIYKGIPHYCIDVADPKKIFTAYDFQKCAQTAIVDILSRGKMPIIVGGTGFYIDVALGRIKLGGVPPNQKLRRKLLKQFTISKPFSTNKIDTAGLLKYLTKLDPKRAKTIEQKNPRRLIRAIEIAKSEKPNAPTSLILAAPARGSEDFAHFRPSLRSGAVPKMAKNPFSGPLGFSKKKCRNVDFAGFEASEQGSRRRRDREASTLSPAAGLGEESKINITTLWLGIKRDPKDLKKRIHNRLLRRLQSIIKEIKKLHANPPAGGGVSWKRLYDFGLEYRHVSLYLRGKLDYKLLTTQLETAIWHYAKRQMTWFKKNKEIRWIPSQKLKRGIGSKRA